MSESLKNWSNVFKILPFIFKKLSILLAVGFSDVSTKTIVYLNEEKGACFSDAHSIFFSLTDIGGPQRTAVGIPPKSRSGIWCLRLLGTR